MKCHFCGKEVWLVRHLRDGDFCSAEHRRKYHERLRRSFEQLPQNNDRPARLAEFNLAVAVAEIAPRARGAMEFSRNGTAGARLRACTTLDVTPLFGQSFFGVPQATEATSSLGHAPGDLRPLAPALRMRPIAESCCVPNSAIPRAQAPVDLPAVNAAAAATAAMQGAPSLADRGVYEPAYPSMVLGAILPEWQLDDLGLAPVAPGAERVNGNAAAHAAQAAARGANWLPLPVEPPEALARPLAEVTAVLTAAIGPSLPAATLNPGGCLPPVAGHPLLLDPACERAESAAERTRPTVQPLARLFRVANLPAAPVPRRPQPVREAGALNGPQAIAPWEIPMPAAEPVARTVTALLPAFAFAPAGAALPADAATVPLAARANDALAGVRGAVGMESGVPAAASYARAWPGLPVSGMHASLPEVSGPRRIDPDTLTPQTQVAAPAAEDRLLVTGRMATPAIGAQSSTPAQARLRVLHGMRPPLEAAHPAPARAVATGPLPQTSAITTARAIPDQAGYRRLVQAPAGPIAPVAAACAARPSVPAPEALRRDALSFRDLSLAIGGTSVFALADSLPVEVYVQRGRTRLKRDAEWRPVGVSALLPACTVVPSPARFEQLVLQDWRRRYPSRNAPVLRPVAQPAGKNVLAMPRRATWHQRLRDGRRFATAVAASIVLCAGIGLTWSSGSLSKMTAGNREWFKQAVARRATFQVADNFRSGLSLWEGRQNWQRTWSHHVDGFMRTGQLALYRPSEQLTNYRLEFFAQIEKKSMGWVVRATDPQNYYAMKFTVTEPGPRPLISVVRYPVIGGKKGRKVQIPVTMMVHNNTPYHVAVDVRGSHFRAFIEDQEVDFWSDNRLARGGVGFFSENDERARLYWVKVSNNTDWLGRLCGMLAGNAGASNEALNLWEPQGDAGRSVAAIDRAGIWDAAKNVDRKRAGPMNRIETQA